MTRAWHALLARGGRTAVLLVAALSVLLGQVATQIHEAASPHVVCAEHDGRVEDAPKVTAKRDAGQGASVTTAPVAAHGHTSCALPLTPNSGALTVLAVEPAVARVAEAVADEPAPEGAPGRTGPPLLHLAPKLSPPVA